MKIQFKRDYPYVGIPRFKSGDIVEAFDSYPARAQFGDKIIQTRILKVKDERGQVWLVEENYDAVVIEVPVEVPQ